jgi:hypothetical protein
MRYAKEDGYPIWRAGQDKIVLLNPNSYEVAGQYFNFWPKGYTPLFLAVSDSLNKVAGYSINQKQASLSLLSNFMNPSQSQTKKLPVGGGKQTWAGMEFTTDGRLLVVPVSVNPGQNSQKYLKMVAVDLSQNTIKPVANEDFKDSAFKIIQFFRKIKGHDFFALACNNHIAIFGFNYSTMKFVLVNFLKNVYRNMVFEIGFSEDYMIPMSTGKDENIKLIEFGKSSHNSLLKQDQMNDGVQKAKMAFIGSLYSKPRVQRLDTPSMGGNKKVDISHDGTTLYFGGDDGLVVMQRQNEAMPFKLVRNEPSLKYFGLRPTPSGHIVLQLKGSNKLVVYNKFMIKDVDFESERVDRVESGNVREPHFSNEGENMIWFGGETSIFVVDLRNLSQTKIDNLLFSDGQTSPEPICVISDFERQKVCLFYELNEEPLLVYYVKGEEPEQMLVNEVFPKYEEVRCVDLHQDKLYGFLGGWTSALDVNGAEISKATVSAFEFNRGMKIIAETELTSQKCTSVSKIVVSKTNRDILYVATDGPLFILSFLSAQKKFEVIKAIRIQNTSCKLLF